MKNLSVITNQNQRVLTTQLLAENYETTERRISENFNANKKRYEEGKHYYCLEGEKLRAFKDQYGISVSVGERTSKLYLWTERGAARHAKILDTDEAWEVYEKLEETYFRVQEQLKPTCIEDLIIMQAQSLKDMREQVNQANYHALEAKAEAEKSREEIQAMRDVVATNSNNWREDCRKLIVRIAQGLGGNGYIGDVQREIYELMRTRLKCKLDVQLTNMRRRMADEGVCKSKRDKLTKLDVIAKDNRLIEGYVAIVKELACRYES